MIQIPLKIYQLVRTEGRLGCFCKILHAKDYLQPFLSADVGPKGRPHRRTHTDTERQSGSEVKVHRKHLGQRHGEEELVKEERIDRW